MHLVQPSLRPDPKNNSWFLNEDYEYTTFDGRYTFVIREGFPTDLASIPSIFTALFDKSDPRTALASLIHDYMIRMEIAPRGYCDMEFKKILDITAPEHIEETYYGAVSFWSLLLEKKRKFLNWINSIRR